MRRWSSRSTRRAAALRRASCGACRWRRCARAGARRRAASGAHRGAQEPANQAQAAARLKHELRITAMQPAGGATRARRRSRPWHRGAHEGWPARTASTYPPRATGATLTSSPRSPTRATRTGEPPPPPLPRPATAVPSAHPAPAISEPQRESLRTPCRCLPPGAGARRDVARRERAAAAQGRGAAGRQQDALARGRRRQGRRRRRRRRRG